VRSNSATSRGQVTYEPTAIAQSSKEAAVIVTMGCGDTCPVYPGQRYLEWELDDPAGQPIEKVRPIVEEVDRRSRALLAELLGEAIPAAWLWIRPARWCPAPA
jgi:protein-tyrosine-phosphatase